jgi:hypothetical protein
VEDFLDDLAKWLSHQHNGLQTFRAFQQKALQLVSEDRDHSALLFVLAALVGRFVEYYDEHPLPVDTADEAFKRLNGLMRSATNVVGRPAAEQLAALNEIARTDLA